MRYFFIFTFTFITFFMFGQEEKKDATLPFQDISDYPDTYSTETIVARMIDGLGFRFYWATEGLRTEDLAFRPTPESRSSEETIDHLMGLSNMILHCIQNKPNVRSGEETSTFSFAQKRKITLDNLWLARESLTSGSLKAEDLKIILSRKDGTQELPLWNLINGPISDGLWHVGQIVTFRRSSGNPFNGKVSVLTGKLRD